jgi:hypothetical protein
MADEYDPFNLRKHPGYYAELVQERDPTHDVAASYVKNHQYDGGILGQLERNPHGLGESPLPFDPSGAELRSTSEGGSAFAERPKDHMQPVAELISPTLGAFGAGQMAGTAYKEVGEGDYQEAGMSLAPLLAGMVVPGAPKGVRGPKAIPREIDARGFYSPSLEAVKGLGQETGTVQQFRSMLLKAGGKPKELEAVGFDRAFPDPNAKVSRGDIEQYLRDNRVQLGDATRYESAAARGSALRRQIDSLNDMAFRARQAGDDATANRLADEIAQIRPLEDAHYAEATKYGHYSTPGGIPGSYREVVTTLNPQSKARYDDLRARRRELNDAEAMELEQLADVHDKNSSNYYESSHWPGIPNPLLHYRVKDFVSGDRAAPADASRLLPSHNAEAGSSPSPQNGIREGGTDQLAARGQTEPSKVRVLDEMQSDWAQRARDQGVKDPAQVAQWRQRKAELEAQRDAIEAEMAAFIADFTGKPMGGPNVNAIDHIPNIARDGNPQAAALMQKWEALIEPQADINTKLNAADNGVPSAPYISNTSDWVDLGLKQALIDAARDPAVSRMAWAPGKVQADRYGLEKDIKTVVYIPETQTFIARPRDGRVGIQETVPPEKLADYVGRETAEKLLAQPLSNDTMGRAHVLSDQELKMGGEGMKSFYGDMTPEGYQSGIVGTRLQKLVKGLDPEAARVEPHGLESPRHVSMAVSDALKDFPMPTQQRNQINRHITDVVEKEGVRALDTYDAPRGFEEAWAAGVQAAKQSDGLSYPSVPITPAMREKILKEGLPLFNVAALSALLSRILGQGQPDTEGEDGGGF